MIQKLEKQIEKDNIFINELCKLADMEIKKGDIIFPAQIAGAFYQKYKTISKGFVLVPIKPTESMLIAGGRQTDAHGFESDVDMVEDIYSTMIQAAQKEY